LRAAVVIAPQPRKLTNNLRLIDRLWGSAGAQREPLHGTAAAMPADACRRAPAWASPALLGPATLRTAPWRRDSARCHPATINARTTATNATRMTGSISCQLIERRARWSTRAL